MAHPDRRRDGVWGEGEVTLLCVLPQVCVCVCVCVTLRCVHSNSPVRVCPCAGV